jgi:biotin synthase
MRSKSIILLALFQQEGDNMELRHNWQKSEVAALYELPFNELMFQAQTVHRKHFPDAKLQIATLCSIKTGACPEDCAYCPQSGHFNTGINKNKLLPLDEVINQAQAAKENGATRFCMGAAWRNPPKKELPKVIEMIKAVKSMGLETCVTLGMLDQEDAGMLKEAGLDYYNHNLDTSPEYYKKIITTRTYEDRLNTLGNVREAGIKVCCGGIIGMGETHEDRIEFLLQLANQSVHPESVPINQLIATKGTPLANAKPIEPIEFVKTIAIARIMMPKSYVRLSAGRESMSDELQALCFMAGANSMFYGETLLTQKNPAVQKDRMLLKKLGIQTHV